MFWSLGFDLTDPQGMNSYSYARNNPIRLVDTNGEWFWDAVKIYGSYLGGAVRGATLGIAMNIAAGVDATIFMATHPVAAAKAIYHETTVIADYTHSLRTSPQARQEASANVQASIDGYFDQSLAKQADQLGYLIANTGVTFYVGQNPFPKNPYVLENVNVLNRSKAVIYSGSVDLRKTIGGIENGTIGPRLDKNGNPKLYLNRERHTTLDYSNGNQYYEYNVVDSGAPGNNAERVLRGTVKNDYHYTGDHYPTLHNV